MLSKSAAAIAFVTSVALVGCGSSQGPGRDAVVVAPATSVAPTSAPAASSSLAASVITAADGPVQEAVGKAPIKGKDEATARQEALAQALKEAVQLAAGVAIKSHFQATQKEISKNEQSEFSSDVTDQLTQDAEGFIQKYEIVHEGAVGRDYEVKVRCVVFKSKIEAEISEMAKLREAAGNPKLLLIIQRVDISMDGKEKVARGSDVVDYLKSELLSRGFELRDQGQSVAFEKSVADYRNWMSQPDQVTALAREAGADLVIVGWVEVEDKGKIDESNAGMFTALIGQTKAIINCSLSGYSVATGDVISSKRERATSMGATGVDQAVERALKGRGKNFIQKLLDELVPDLKRTFVKMASERKA